MRCQFCGWDNPETTSVCSKCGQPLTNNPSQSKSTIRDSIADNHEQMTQRKPTIDNFNPKATVREISSDAEYVEASDAAKLTCCPNCGIEMDIDTDFCPCCGTAVKNINNSHNAINDAKKTVRPQHSFRVHPDDKLSTPGFKLSLISNDGTAIKELEFIDTEAVLNRDNTEPENNTITSQSQATIKHENGKWTIIDNSAMQSTYVQASQPIELHDGALILLGDRVFKFEESQN